MAVSEAGTSCRSTTGATGPATISPAEIFRASQLCCLGQPGSYADEPVPFAESVNVVQPDARRVCSTEIVYGHVSYRPANDVAIVQTYSVGIRCALPGN